jgi:hypothetical protein
MTPQQQALVEQAQVNDEGRRNDMTGYRSVLGSTVSPLPTLTKIAVAILIPAPIGTP